MPHPTALQVRHDDLRVGTPVPLELPPLAADQVRFRVDRFALTANNVTYAAHGDDLGYWRFYPAPEGVGIVPVWGFGTVLESRADGVAPGDRFYGYWPMATHAVLTAVDVAPHGFTEGSPHRAGLAPIYNSYSRWTEAHGDEATAALFRPLFTTGFLLADQIAGDGASASAALMSSASSKTSLSLAHMLEGAGMTRIGLTSPRNRGFVERTGAYDLVLGYDEIERIEAPSAVLVDFAGDPLVQRRIHERFGEQLAASLVVGDTHWDARGDGGPLPGPTPQFFFAPAQRDKRLADWGADEFERRLADRWARFVGFARRWLELVEGRGPDEVARQWQRLASGNVNPAQGIILSMHG